MMRNIYGVFSKNNYLIFYEADIIIDYLFEKDQPKIKRLYQHLDKAAIEKILENLLNILVDKKDEKINLVNSKYYKIIIDLLNELTNDNNYEKNDNNYEKAGFICELIINTLFNNNEKVLIELIFYNKEENNMLKILLYIFKN